MNGENSAENPELQPSPNPENPSSELPPVTSPEPAPAPEPTKVVPLNELGIAQVVHEINSIFCKAIGDNSHVSWDELSTELKESILAGVAFHTNYSSATAAEGHERWLETKRKQGYKYGPVKNEEKCEHPCFLPFVDLPKEQKAKDHIFKAVVNSLS